MHPPAAVRSASPGPAADASVWGPPTARALLGLGALVLVPALTVLRRRR